jgi:RNA polymerase sigma-70 factor, ECF subfamily
MNPTPHQACSGGASDLEVRIRRLTDAMFADLYRKAGAERFGLTQQEFSQILEEVRTKYLPADAGEPDALDLYRSLRLEELALARACAAGNDAAWDVFLVRYREKLYDAARSIAPSESTARELADSLYAELFGTETRDSRRISKLNYYAGRGSLEGWLRMVLAQEYVNLFRSQRRLVSLDEQAEAGVQFRAPNSAAMPEASIAPDPRLEAATDEALAALPAEERFILASCYLDGRTLAETARMLAVHESTISRRLAKITKSLSKAIAKGLVSRGMSRRQAEEALETDVRDLSLDIGKQLRPENARNGT